ncbi:hypothetical protein TYRP_003074 [Tyrophagus putrescentiae]|nr:hypothetical protein TYRP_003074 [Tyrophagus putrescentiae]
MAIYRLINRCPLGCISSVDGAAQADHSGAQGDGSVRQAANLLGQLAEELVTGAQQGGHLTEDAHQGATGHREEDGGFREEEEKYPQCPHHRKERSMLH